MNIEQRLKLINKVSRSLHKDLFHSDSNLEAIDKAWLIGLLSDHTLSEEKLINEVERVKKEFIDLRALLEY
jgi:hypothetical protein|tara:strand:- start:353 stop:565 length:213 start_codon:yes stop_codon:yes gene_type:complete